MSVNEPAAMQFETSEPVEAPAAVERVRCAACGASLTSYFDVTGAIACAACKDRAVAERGAGHAGGLLRATGLGVVAAALGAGLYYGVAALTGYEIGLISIAVGLLVGFAVKRGARGRGGWRYQALAMFLTYAAIASAYLPHVFRGIAQAEAEQAAPAPAAVAPVTPDPAPAEAPTAGAEPAPAGAPDPVGVGKALVMLAGLTLALPVLVGMESPMSVLLMAIALYEAWKVNRAAPFAVTGPFAVAGWTARDG